MFEELRQLTLEPLHRLTDQLAHLVEKRLWAKVLLGMGLGVALGFALGPEAGWVEPGVARIAVSWLALPGRLFLALVQMVVIALVFASIIRGLGAADDVEQLRSLGLRTAVYFVLTSAVAISLGIGLTLLLGPGRGLSMSQSKTVAPAPSDRVDIAGVPELIVELVPTNPLAAMVGGEMLQVVLFAIVMGVALVSMPLERSRPLFDLLGSLQEVCMTIVKWAMGLAPVAVFGLMTQTTATLGLELLKGLGFYVLTVLAGLLALVLIYGLLAALLGRCSPLKFFSAAREVQLLAFSTSSSAAVMPLSMRTAEEKLEVRPSSARVLIPLGATINMDGTALYQGVATVFLAQAFDVSLSLSSLGLVVVTAVVASIGAPATPGVGIVVLAGVLEGAGIPSAGIAIVLGVDRLLDMARTAVNVTGDLTASLVLDRWMGEITPTESAPD